MENICEKHEIVSERVFEENSTNKINLEGKRNFKIEF